MQSNHLFGQYENNDAVYLSLTKEYTLYPEGSMDYRYQKKLKLQTYRAFSSLYGETFIVYNPKEQKLKINEAFTIMADGKKVPIPENALNEVLPGFCTSAPAYNHLREMVITHTGLERDAVINLDYTIHTDKGYYPAFMGNELLAESEPVKELSIIIKVPASNSSGIRYLASGFRLQASGNNTPAITIEGNFKVYTWNFKDVPAISTEEYQKSGYEFYPRLIFSNSDGREKIYKDFMSQPAFRYEAGREMKQTVVSILLENKETTDIILKLQDKVVNEVRLWPVPLRYTGFKCRTASETWNSNGGTLAEKGILLVVLLKAAGIASDIVLVIKTSYFNQKTGTLLDIEDVLVKTDLKDSGPLYLSVNSVNQQNLKYGLAARTMVILTPGKNPEYKNGEDLNNKLQLKGELFINVKRQLLGGLTATFDNGFNPWLALLRDNNKVKSLFSGGLGSQDLTETKIITSGQEGSNISVYIKKDKPLRKDTNFYTWTLPYFNHGIESWDIKVLPKERTTALEIPSKAEENYEIDLQVPVGFKLFSPGSKKEISNKAGSFLFEIRQSFDKISIKKRIKFNERIIDPADYTAFKALMDHWNSDRYREIIFTQ